MNLKIGGNSVGKIMYGGQEFGGVTKLEPGTILYVSNGNLTSVENTHLLSTTKNWNNLNGINVRACSNNFSTTYVDVDIPSDDFKNVDINKSYSGNGVFISMNISTSIVDGEYRLNISVSGGLVTFVVKAI